MQNKKMMAALVLVFVLLLGGAYLLYNKLSGQVAAPQLGTREDQTTQSQESADPSASAQEERGDPAPDFTTYDLEGNPVRLSDFLGKPVILNFWASWCGPCKSEMPAFQTAYETYGEEVHFLLVNMTDGSQETLETASSFLADSGYTFPVYYDTEYSAAIAYGVRSLPTTYFIDAEGYGVAYANAPLTLELLEQGIGMILD